MLNPNAIIVEIRAGAGGEEASLFAADLFNLYSKYAVSKDWKVQILDSNKTGLNGIKQIIFKLKGAYVFEKMKFEGGVHRVQRVPKTEKSNRLHTSTVSVAILPVPETFEIKIKPNDIRMDFFKSTGKGGQNVNKRQTAIRITHLPTGLVVSSQTQRNLEQNKQTALAILEAKLFEQQQKKATGEVGENRREQIGGADRAEKIRTYNFPQDRITDHRIKKSWHNIEKIMSGNFDPIIKKLQKS